MCVQRHAVSPHSCPDLAYNHHSHYISPTSGRPPYAHATTHLLVYVRTVLCTPCTPYPPRARGPPRTGRLPTMPAAQTRRPRLFGATLAFASQFQIDRCCLSTTHGQGLPLPTFTSQGLGSENKSTGAKKQFLTSQLPKPRRVLLAATRPARPARPAADDSSMTPGLQQRVQEPQGTTSLAMRPILRSNRMSSGCHSPWGSWVPGFLGSLASWPSSAGKDEVLVFFPDCQSAGQRR